MTELQWHFVVAYFTALVHKSGSLPTVVSYTPILELRISKARFTKTRLDLSVRKRIRELEFAYRFEYKGAFERTVFNSPITTTHRYTPDTQGTITPISRCSNRAGLGRYCCERWV
ncbi:hypothetical protein J6590_103726, partial [Homalodisca vitripennis]